MPKQIEVLHGIDESGRHLLSLINDILDLSKIEAGRLELEHEPVFLGEICTLSLRMVAQMALMKRVKLSSSLDAMVQTIHADERRIKQIIVNLLSNAAKFTPAGGKVGLDMRGDAAQQTVTLSVWDTGIGIAEADLRTLFQPFVQIDSQLSRQHEGTGLGLALVLRLTEAHGGSMSVESTPGQGSRFSVTLPWDTAADRSAPTPAPDVVAAPLPSLSQALVIEDSTTAADQLTRYLREIGVQVEVLPYATGTVERAIALQPDVILLDILLPDASGWDVLRQLKAEPRTQAIPVIVVSVVDEPARARALGAAAMLRKPIEGSAEHRNRKRNKRNRVGNFNRRASFLREGSFSQEFITHGRMVMPYAPSADSPPAEDYHRNGAGIPCHHLGWSPTPCGKCPCL
jgi:CheY-like chemotaxis protein